MDWHFEKSLSLETKKFAEHGLNCPPRLATRRVKRPILTYSNLSHLNWTSS